MVTNSTQISRTFPIPDELLVSSLEFLQGKYGSLCEGDKTVVATAQVCKQWKESRALNRAKNQIKNRFQLHNEMKLLTHCPKTLIKLFAKNSYPIFQLPLLDAKQLNVKELMQGRGPRIKLEEMEYPVMRFKDVTGRIGIALNIYAHKEIKLSSLSSLIVSPSFKERGHHAILLLFQYGLQRSFPNHWFFTWGNHCERPLPFAWPDNANNAHDKTIEFLYKYRHRELPFQRTPSPLPFRQINLSEEEMKIIASLLSGTDPDFSLAADQPVMREDDDGKEPS